MDVNGCAVNSENSSNADNCISGSDWTLTDKSIKCTGGTRMSGGKSSVPPPSVVTVESLTHAEKWVFTPRLEYQSVCGSYNATALFSYVAFRFLAKGCNPRVAVYYKRCWWWVEDLKSVARELNLTVPKIRHARAGLVERRLIVVEEHIYSGPISRYNGKKILYWRPVIAGGAAGLSDWPSIQAVQAVTANEKGSQVLNLANDQMLKLANANTEFITSGIDNEKPKHKKRPSAGATGQSLPSGAETNPGQAKSKPQPLPPAGVTPSPDSAAPLPHADIPSGGVKTSAAAPAVVARYLRFKRDFVEHLRAIYAAEQAAKPYKKLKPSELLTIERSIDCITVDAMTPAEASALERLEYRLQKLSVPPLMFFDWLSETGEHKQPKAVDGGYLRWGQLRLALAVGDLATERVNVLWLLKNLESILAVYRDSLESPPSKVLPVVQLPTVGVLVGSQGQQDKAA